MELTQEMNQAFNLIENTTECLYITGKAGTGKTTFLRYIVENSKKKLAVTASTGIAAVNAGGTTLHSLLGIPLTIQNPNEPMGGRLDGRKTQFFESLEVLVIDEISMVRPDMIDYIDKKLRLYKMCDQPFGGVQIVMFGDLYQLPPVVKAADKKALLEFYRGVYFFYAHIFRECGFRVIELTNVFRQSDERFVEILNNIRNYNMTNLDVEDLESLRDRRASQVFDNDHIHICTYRKDVQKINSQMLGEPTHEFKAKYTGDFKPSAAPCDDLLQVRVGARVMMLINDQEHRFYNGSMGNISKITKAHITVELDNGEVVTVAPHEWTLKDYKINKGEIETVDKGSCKQFPISLAWAITIHKSQGLTFDKVTIHTKHIFCPGQLYVALSRCTSMEGIVSESYIGKRSVIPDNELIAFETAYQENGGIFDKKAYRSMNLR